MKDAHVVAIIAAIIYAGEGIELETAVSAGSDVSNWRSISKEDCVETAKEFLAIALEQVPMERVP